MDGAEVMLVERLVETGWRLRRFPSVEASLYGAQLLEEQAGLVRAKARCLLQHRVALRATDAADPAACQALFDQELEIREQLNSPEYALGRVFRRDARTGEAFTRLARSEALMERGFYRCLRELRELQKARAEAEAAAAQEAEAAGRRRKPETQNEPTDPATRLSGDELLNVNQFPRDWEREHLERQKLYQIKPRPKD